mmetsp:Transcript_27509/g.50766  ORF Transcript_27509/g.50766 Transcript_27509/m.50766 type:complete len:117 (+) Transcript_27509:907-1257(+)
MLPPPPLLLPPPPPSPDASGLPPQEDALISLLASLSKATPWAVGLQAVGSFPARGAGRGGGAQGRSGVRQAKGGNGDVVPSYSAFVPTHVRPLAPEVLLGLGLLAEEMMLDLHGGR